MKKFLLLLVMATSLSSCTEEADNAPCFTCHQQDPKPEPKEYKIELRGESPAGEQYPLDILYYKDSNQGDITSVAVSSQTNTDIIESKNVMSFNQVGFRFTVGSGGQANISSVVITDVAASQVIFQNHTLNVTPGKIFMYVISSNSYTVTN